MKVGFACVGFLLFTLEGILVSIGVFSSVVEAMVTPVTLLGVSFLCLDFLLSFHPETLGASNGP